MYGLVSPGKNCCWDGTNWTCVLMAFVFKKKIRENCSTILDVFSNLQFFSVPIGFLSHFTEVSV